MASTIPLGYEAKLPETVTVGDDLTVRHVFKKVPRGQALATLTWTVKTDLADSDANAVWQKTITTADVVNVGQIEDTGFLSGKSVSRFDVPTTQVAACQPGVIHLYDFEAVSTAGKTKTVSKGHFIPQAQVTQS